MGFGQIVVATDFSQSSIRAFRRAAALLGPDSSIHLVHVIDRPSRGDEAADRDATEKVKRELFRFAERHLEGARNAPVQAHVARGRPAERILKRARTCHADLIVVGSHARGRVARVVLGSVSEELARISEIPVLIVRETVPNEVVPERVLVALDATPHSRIAARAGVVLAEQLGVEAVGISVVPEIIVPGASDDVRAEIVELAGLALPAETMKTLRGRVRYVRGEPSSTIADMATPSDVVVCGTHGRSTLGRLAFGSVATKLVRTVPCPILVVRPSRRADAPLARTAVIRKRVRL
jgi:nucleotide-binding universal stress UspA family protein